MARSVEEFRAEHREKSIQRNMQSCRHFNGVQNGVCLAGVNYETAHPDGTTLPCIPIGPDASKRAACTLRSDWTREESEANEDERERRSAMGLIAMNAAHADAKGKGLGKKCGGTGSLKCPVCPDGTLRYSVAGYNGHMHAACTTKGCVSWME